jgi:nicotinamide-nucleotide amidase
MFTKPLIAQANKLIQLCERKGLMITTAESCTGGLIAALLTEVPGSSAAFERGFVTYSNAAKTAQLGVPAALIKRHGAVSAQVAAAMACGALKKSKAQLAVAVTGIAGPTGGTKEKPVGLVYTAIAHKKSRSAVAQQWHFKGDRSAIRKASAEAALSLLTALASHSS